MRTGFSDIHFKLCKYIKLAFASDRSKECF